MLSALLNVPSTEVAWLHFAWDHRDSHDRIREAILAKYKVRLSSYQVEPINPDSISTFLTNNAQMHTDMNTLLRLQSSDMEDVDLKDKKQLEAWVLLHYQEHQAAELALGL